MRYATGLAALALASGACTPAPVRPDEPDTSIEATLADLPRARIVLMSSLPLVHGEPQDIAALIAGQGEPHPFYVALDEAHDLRIADALNAATLAGADLAVVIQPRALPPEQLVALDDYVRTGGRLLLFTDPALEWPSRFGLGDPRGPQRVALMSPLLTHWGLELIDPGNDSVRLPQSGAMLHRAGRFARVSGITGDGGCTLDEGDHLARCRIGAGRAILVADADVLNHAYVSDSADSRAASRRFIVGLLQDLLEGTVS